MPQHLGEKLTAKHAMAVGLFVLVGGFFTAPPASAEMVTGVHRTCESVFSLGSANIARREFQVDHRILDAAFHPKHVLRQKDIHNVAYRLVLSNLEFFAASRGFDLAHEVGIEIYQGLHGQPDPRFPFYLAKATLKQGDKEFDFVVTFRSNGFASWLQTEASAVLPESGLRGVAYLGQRELSTFSQADLSIDDVSSGK